MIPDGMEVIPNGWDSPVYGYPLGYDHWYTYTVNRSGAEVGIIVWHRDPATGEIHAGGVEFGKWQLVSRDPLHTEPSILCSCGDHGWIRDGQWVSA